MIILEFANKRNLRSDLSSNFNKISWKTKINYFSCVDYFLLIHLLLLHTLMMGTIDNIISIFNLIINNFIINR